MKYIITNRLRTILIIFTFFCMSAGCELVDNIRGGEDEETVSLHPILLNGEWGYIDNNGSIVIPPQFETARDFSNGYAAVRSNQSWGFINESTKQLTVQPSFNIVGNFNENGLTQAQALGEPYGFINTSGEFAIPAQYDLALEFSESRAAVRVDGQWGFIDETGNMIIETTFSDARSFSEGLAAVETVNGWVYIDLSGEIIINPNFQITTALDFSEGLAPIQTTDGWGFIDINGAPIITPEFDEAGVFSEGLAWLRDDDYIGFVDKEGTFAIDFQFGEAKNFSEDLAAVRLSSNWYYVNRKTGRLQFARGFSEAESFTNGVARITEGSDDDPRFGYINKKGEYIWFPTQ